MPQCHKTRSTTSVLLSFYQCFRRHVSKTDVIFRFESIVNVEFHSDGHIAECIHVLFVLVECWVSPIQVLINSSGGIIPHYQKSPIIDVEFHSNSQLHSSVFAPMLPTPCPSHFLSSLPTSSSSLCSRCHRHCPVSIMLLFCLNLRCRWQFAWPPLWTLVGCLTHL